MIASHQTIQRLVEHGPLRIVPFTPDRLQPNSYDVCLSAMLWLPFDGMSYEPVRFGADLSRYGRASPLSRDTGYVLAPHAFVLGSTYEWISVPSSLAVRVEGRSSGGRMGLIVHSTAGYIDAGFEGYITFEMTNIAPWPIRLMPYDRVAQLSVEFLDEPTEHPYQGKYRHQEGPTPAREEAR